MCVNVKSFGALGNDLADDTAAIIAAMNASETVYFPPGIYRVAGSTAYDLTRPMTYLKGDGATIRLPTNAANLTWRVPVHRSTSLAADAAADAVAIQVTDASDVAVGDLIHIDTATHVETAWKYHKQCVRAVAGISGTTITLDQPLDFFFTVGENTRVDFSRPRGVQIDGMNLICGFNNPYAQFLRTTGSAWRNATLEGPVEGWATGWSDVMYTVSCDRTTYENITFRKSRYSPQIMQGSRYTTVRNFLADQVRHLEVNTWPSDTIFENGIGVNTDGIIQSHPSIRNTFRNIHDSVNQTGVFGLDLRGLGETVEDCSSVNVRGEVGVNTNGPLLTGPYVAWAQERFTRRLRRFRSTTAGIGCRNHKACIVEDCDVPILFSNGLSHSLGALYVDDKTKAGRINITHLNYHQPRHAVDVPVVNGFAWAAAPTDISGITPSGTVTSVAHGLRQGDHLRITYPTGMTELSGKVYRAANVTADTFDLADAAMTPVDTTGLSAYVSGGRVTKQKPAIVVDRAKHVIGLYPKAHFRIPLVPSDGGVKTVALYANLGGSNTQGRRWGFITVRAMGISVVGATGGDFTEAVFRYSYRLNTTGENLLAPVAVPERSAIYGRAVTITDARLHGHHQMVAEGYPLANPAEAYPGEVYWSFDLALSGPAAALEIEVEEYVQTAFQKPFEVN